MDFAGLLLGPRKRDSRKIGPFEGIPAMGLDALASIAYGPEAALLVLARWVSPRPCRRAG